MKRRLKALKLNVAGNVASEDAPNKVAEVKSGSVTVAIFQSRNSRKIPKEPVDGVAQNGTPEFEIKYYDSFIIPYYEGSIRKTPRRNTLEKAMNHAEEVAKRLSKGGAKAEFLSEKDRRIYTLAKASAKKLNLDVDAACQKLVELHERLKAGTLEQAVDFHNDHGQRVKHGVANTIIYEEYLEHMESVVQAITTSGTSSATLARSLQNFQAPSVLSRLPNSTSTWDHWTRNNRRRGTTTITKRVPAAKTTCGMQSSDTSTSRRRRATCPKEFLTQRR